MKRDRDAELVATRATEEIAEAGSTAAAIAHVEHHIGSEDTVREERRFMRKVLAELQRRMPAEFHDDALGQGRR